MPNKARDQKLTRPNAHLEKRLEAVKNGPGKLLKPKKAKAKADTEAAQAQAEPAQTVPSPQGAHPAAYGLRIEDGSLGLHATPGAIVVVEPTIPTKAGLAVFYLKGQPVPAIFDLPRTFNPETLRPWGPGSEVMPVVEAFAPETGAPCHIPANRIEKAHRIIGVQTPVDSSTAWRPMPKRLPEMAQCPEGMGEHVLADASMYPLIRPGEIVIFDPSQRDPENVAAFVLEWSNGTRSVLETSFRQSGGTGEALWWADPVNRPVSNGTPDQRALFASDGPFTEEHLRSRIVGRVVGILAPLERPLHDDGAPSKTLALPAPAAEPQPPSPPAPGSAEARAAWHAACHEHSIRTAPLSDCPELMRAGHEVWTTQSLTQAMETGEITVADYARLQPLASERELRFAEITHELNIGGLFALAYANEYPVASDEDAPASAEADPIFAAIEETRRLDGIWQATYAEWPHDTTEPDELMRRREAACAAMWDHWRGTALKTVPTTPAGCAALARYVVEYHDRDDGDLDEDGHQVLRLIAQSPMASVRSALGIDPVFAVIAASQQAEAAMAAFELAPTGPDEETAIILAQNEARRAVWATQPTTTAGLRALAEYTKEQARLYAGDDWRSKAKRSDFGDYYLSLLSAIETLHGKTSEQDEPLTVESAASLSFQAYTFDMPLRSPPQWAASSTCTRSRCTSRTRH